MQSQPIEVPFDHENGVVRNSQLCEAEETPAFIDDKGVGGVDILRLRRSIDSPPTESYSGSSLIGNGKHYSTHEWASYPLLLLFQESNAKRNFLPDPGLLEGGNEIFDRASISKRELLLGCLVEAQLREIVH